MAFDATISLGNILTAILTVAGGFLAWHKWDTKVELRHHENKNQIATITGQIDRVDAKVDRVELKIDENTRTTNGVRDHVNELKGAVDRHCALDEAYQKVTDRRLDRLEP